MQGEASQILVRLHRRRFFRENTLRANSADLQATLLRRRVLVDESHLNLSINDQELSLPIILGPVGMAGMYSNRGEVKAAKLKGILDPEDRRRAVQTNIDAILVSNHGGRRTRVRHQESWDSS